MSCDPLLQRTKEARGFEREDRYIVFKKTHLTDMELRALQVWIAPPSGRAEGHVVPTVDCVVVERDWPEYETVWRMIEDRVAGKVSVSSPPAVGECGPEIFPGISPEGGVGALSADAIVAEIMAYCQINSHDARELARLIIARLASADAYEAGKRAGIEHCIHVLRGNLLAGYGPDAKAQRDADIAILDEARDRK